jgi:phage terminase small subunit
MLSIETSPNGQKNGHLENEMGKKTKPLDPRADLFCSCYTAVGTPTFNHKEASAVAAGFSEASARNQATRLLRKPAIQRRIDELKAANRQRNNVSVDSVVENLTHDRDMARAKGDWSAAIRADELLGKVLGCFTDRQELVAPERQQDLDERERAECLALAAIRLGACLSLPGGDGEAVGGGEGGEKCPEDIPHHPPNRPRPDSILPG